ncbi:unnamed protein product [Coregonus sp. 'balchen']|nr:unnamed protein product [Coregonus sp. 'balchen']
MAAPFKIPKRKQPPEADSMHMQSPLSRVQDTSRPFETSWCNGSSNGKKPEQVGSLNGHISRAGKVSAHNRLVLRDVCKARLGPSHPDKGNSSQSTGFQRPAQTPEHRPVTSQRGDSSEHSKWREAHRSSTLWRSPPRFQLAVNRTPRKQMESLTHEKPPHLSSPRASDTLCRDKNQASPLLKMRRAEFTEPSPEREADSSSKMGDRPSKERTGSSGSLQDRIKRSSGSSGTHPRGSVPVPAGHRSQSSESDDPPDRPLTSGARGASTGSPRHSPSAVASVTRATQEKRLSLSRSPLPANPNLTDRERRPPTKCLSLHLRLRRPKPTTTEPIVLSSEDEEGHDDEEECPRLKTPQQGHSPRQSQPTPEEHVPKQAVVGEKVTGSQRVSEHNPCSTQPLPPIMELSFSTLHAGVVRAQANGNLVVTDDGITLPLKDSRVSSEEEGGVSVSLVASQLRGYAVWDGGLAQDGSLFQGCPGRVAPSLLFLWVSEAQANLVQTELSALHPVTLPASMLDVEAFRQGRSYDLKSPLSWADGLALIHSCPQDAHFLTLLGQSLVADPNPGLGTAKGSPSRTRGNHRSRERYSRHQGLLPTRLIQYPPLPSKGGITVTTEDLDCLDSGQFLNDVIIDFYLKYLLLERAPGPLAERCHVFSSFFYKQLTRRDTSLEEEAAIPARDRRHQRVRTWTRHVDIFNKDYLFVPVNHQAHWYLVVICFPGLEQAQHEEWSGPAGVEASGGKRKCQPQASAGPSPGPSNPKLQNGTGGTGEARGKPTLRPHNPPDNSSDCGLYLLQYVESFLQNPVVHFDLPLRLERWFPRQQVWRKREEIRSLVMELHGRQGNGESSSSYFYVECVSQQVAKVKGQGVGGEGPCEVNSREPTNHVNKDGNHRTPTIWDL